MHPFADLSAYLDDALDPQTRASVQAHLASCATCRTRLSELRGTVRLIAALPPAVPSRSLVPRVSVPFWLAPLRAASAIASGLATVVFVVSLLGGASLQSSAPAAAPLDRTSAAGGGAASPAPALPAPGASEGAFAVSGAASPTPKAPTAADSTRLDRSAAATSAAPEKAGAPTAVAFSAQAETRPATSPVIWLALAVVFGAIAIFLSRRLHARQA